MAFPRNHSVALALAALAMIVSALFIAPSHADAQRRRGGRGHSQAAHGTLVVRSQQNGAEVFIDETSVGTVPLAPQQLPVGEHTLRVRLPGYTDFTDVFSIDANAETALDVELLAIATVLNVASTPSGAQVFVDDRFAGDTPTRVEVLEGEHSLRLHLPGYHDHLQQVTAAVGQAQELNLSLVALPADEDPTRVEAAPRNWYEKPWTWVGVGVAAVAVTVGVIILVSMANSAREIDDYCMTEQGCVIVQPGF